MKKLKSMLMSLVVTLGVVVLAGCGEPPPPPENIDWNNNSVIEVWEEKFESIDRPTNRDDIAQNYVTISTLTEFKAINENYDSESTTVYFLTNDIDCKDEVIRISLRNNILLGNNYVITNFKLERPNGGESVCLFEGEDTAAIYDLRVYGRLQNIAVDASNPSLTKNYASFFNNIQTLDNITTKGCFDINRTKALGDSTRYNVDATLMAMNCKYINNCTAIGIINYTETAGNATGTKQFAGIDITNGLDSNESDAYITNCTSKVVMNIYSESTTLIGGITVNSFGRLIKNTVDETSLINVATYDSITESEDYKNVISFGGICNNAHTMNNLKHNIYAGTLNANVELTDYDFAPLAHINAAAIAKSVDGSILSYNQAKGNINITNFKSVNVAGFTCTSKNAMYHYNTCTTDISVDNVMDATVAQFSTKLEYGFVEYLLMDSNIYVNAPYPDAVVNTGVFSLMNTVDGEEKAMPNLYKILFMGNTSFRLPASNTNLNLMYGFMANSDNYQPMMYSQRRLYYTDSYTIKRLTPTDDGEDVSTDILNEIKPTLDNSVANISDATVNYSWLFSQGLAFNTNYTGITATSGIMKIDDIYFKNITESNYHEEQLNTNILEGVRFDYYLDSTYKGNKQDELYCILASKLQAREPFTIAFSESYLNNIMTQFEAQNKVDALVDTIEDILKTKGLITNSETVFLDITNEAGLIIGKEIKIVSDTTKTIKIDTQALEDNVNWVTIIITEQVSNPHV
ncbi:MAG: hypothetical protein J6V40_02405 [Clostridia bacterium]|nr:hypothetical protein [Clostridia bacterium]